MEPSTRPRKPFLSIAEFGQLFEPPLGRARAYALAHELGVALRLGQRKLVVPRRAIEELESAAVARARGVLAAVSDQ